MEPCHPIDTIIPDLEAVVTAEEAIITGVVIEEVAAVAEAAVAVVVALFSAHCSLLLLFVFFSFCYNPAHTPPDSSTRASSITMC